MKKFDPFYHAPNFEMECCRFFFYSALAFFFYDRFRFDPSIFFFFEPSGSYKFLNLPPPGPWLVIAIPGWILMLIFSAIGFLTRPAMILSFIGGLYILGLEWAMGKTHHQFHLIAIVLGILAFSRCGQTLSLDSVLRRWAKRSYVYTDENWAIKFCQLAWCLLFLGAGIAKLRNSGFHFFDPDNMRNILLFREIEKGPPDFTVLKFAFDLIISSPVASVLASISVIVLELLVPVVFFVKAPIRIFLISSCFVFQILNLFILKIGFVETFALYVFWIPWSQVTNWIGAQAGIVFKHLVDFRNLPLK